MAYLASRVKTNWSIDSDGLRRHAQRIANRTREKLQDAGILDDTSPLLSGTCESEKAVRLLTLPEEAQKLLVKKSISPLPLHKTLVLLGELRRDADSEYHRHELLALARALVASIGNLHFGPEVGVGRMKADAPVVEAWLDNVFGMVEDLERFRDRKDVEAQVYYFDSRRPSHALKAESVDAVITSPPYPNEKDYTRTTRLESVLLGLVRSREELRSFKKTLIRSNTRNVYKGDDDDQWIAENREVTRLAKTIEGRRISLGKTSGFERLYSRVTRLYFGGMARHLAALRKCLRPGAMLAYVVGDQASYLRVMIRTGQILSEIAEGIGYETVGTDLFRTRFATTTGEQLREEVVVLRWPG